MDRLTTDLEGCERSSLSLHQRSWCTEKDRLPGRTHGSPRGAHLRKNDRYEELIQEFSGKRQVGVQLILPSKLAAEASLEKYRKVD